MNLDYVKYLLVLLLTIGVTDLDFHIGYPILDQQLHILIILVCLSLVLNSEVLLILGFCLFFGFFGTILGPKNGFLAIFGPKMAQKNPKNKKFKNRPK